MDKARAGMGSDWELKYKLKSETDVWLESDGDRATKLTTIHCPLCTVFLSSGFSAA
jgi:hypothetical protein